MLSRTAQSLEAGYPWDADISWDEARAAWSGVIGRLQTVRRQLGCSWHGAWFRGHAVSSWHLEPRLFRSQNAVIRQEVERNRAEILRQITALRKMRRQGVGKVTESEKLRSGKASEREDIEALKRQLKGLLSYYEQNDLVKAGEMEAYDEWTYRSDRPYETSWHVLAEMTHYGAKTRLLDWTEVFTTALFFALERYYESLTSLWQKNRGFGKKPPTGEELLDHLGHGPSDHPSLATELAIPTVWVLNPYRLARLLDPSQERILAVSNRSELDYYKHLLCERGWPWALPVPAYSPWRSPRLAAQRGTFLIFGKCHASLDETVAASDKQWQQILGYPRPVNVGRIAQRVDITPAAAIFGVRQLIENEGVDRYTLFRHREALARRINSEFFSDS